MTGNRKACYGDIEKIQKFISQNYRENHILSSSRALFVNEYFELENNLNPYSAINMFINEKNGKINAILGYYEYENEYYLSLWSAKSGSIFGILLLKYAEKELIKKPIRVIGLSKEAEYLYAKLGYTVDSMDYLYCSKSEKKIKYSDGKKVVISDVDDIRNKPYFSNLKHYKKYLVNNVFYDYLFYEFPEKEILVIYKKVESPENNFLLIVDIIGKQENITSQELVEILDAEKENYITIYTNQKIRGMNYVENSDMIFPIYNAPYVPENITIKYAYKDTKPIVFLFRGDQERPAKLNDKYALVNNFMYHYIRNDNQQQTVTNYISEKEFDAHIVYLEKNYTNLSLNDLEKRNFSENKEYYMLSFDDGYKEHMTYAAKKLSSKKIEGHFFIPYIENDELLLVNKVHQVLNYYSTTEILKYLRRNVSDYIKLYNKYSKVESLDSPDIIFIKRFFQKEQNGIKLCEELLKKIPIENYENYYMNAKDIMELKKNHIVGNHTCKHNHLTSYNACEIIADIRLYEKNMIKYMDNKIISYPYGSNNSEIREIYAKKGYKFGWTTQNSYSIISPMGSLMINRYDANELNHLLNSRKVEENL